jgi:tetratricopeptide (TPR) repeat protein
MKCQRCAAENADTDRFCSRCGALLSRPDEGAHDPQRAAELVETAFQLSDAGELDEAVRVAEQAVALNPRSTSAHSILAILLYRKGDTERAVVEYEAVLSLSPESSADRARLEEIMGVRRHPRQRRWRALLAGALALLLVVLIGLIILFTSLSPQRPATRAATAPRPITPGAGPAPVTAPLPPTPPPAIAPVAPPTPTAPPATSPLASSGSTFVRAQPPASLPALPPVQPTITLPAEPGSAGAAGPPPVSESEREARRLFLNGDFEGAAEAYRRTLDELPQAPARVHQDLALSLMRAGRFPEALAEYQIAAEGYRQQIARGLEVASAQHGLAVCERAISALEALP